MGIRARSVTAWVGAALLAASLQGTSLAADRGTFTYSFPADIISLDPQSTRTVYNTNFLANIMEPLVRQGVDYKPEPALAERWQNPSPTVWRFFLRPDVKFHSGNPFTADDVVFTIERAKNPKSPTRGLVISIASVRKIDAMTVELDTNGPDPTLLRELPSVLMLDSKWAIEHNGAEPTSAASKEEGYLTRHVSGTGPYRLVQYTPGVSTTLEANPDWWDKAHASGRMTEIVFRPIASNPTRVAALLSGELDLIDPLPLDDVQRIRQTPGFKVISGPSARTIMLGLDTRNAELEGSNIKGANPFKNIRVRQAVYQAINTDALIDKILDGFGTPAPAVISSSIAGYDKRLEGRVLPYDPDAARKLLAEAGYPKGFQFDLDCPTGRYIADDKTCLALVSMLAKVGLDAKVTSRTPALHFAEIGKGKSSAFLMGYGTDLVLDGNLFLTEGAHTPNGTSYGAENYGSYSNAKVDALSERAATELDPAKRQDLLVEAYQALKQDLGFVPLYNESVVWGARSDIMIAPTVTDVLWLYRVRRQ